MTAVEFRTWTAADADWYAVTTRDPEIQSYTSEPAGLSTATVVAAIGRLESRPDQDGYLIGDPVTGGRIGNIAAQYDGPVAEVSYWIAPAARGRGFATAALVEMCRRAFDRDGVEEIRLWTHTQNVASQRVALRAGFVPEPARDRVREVKGENWSTRAYVLRAEMRPR
jgi:RimJ/RimL family protein N-acetyltransferase